MLRLRLKQPATALAPRHILNADAWQYGQLNRSISEIIFVGLKGARLYKVVAPGCTEPGAKGFNPSWVVHRSNNA